MKRLILLFFAALFFAAPLTVRCEITDRIVAIVNDDIVTLREVERFVAVEKKSRYTSMNEYVTNMELREKLEVFIENQLIKQQAKKFKVEVGKKEIDATIAEIRKQNLITESELKEQLKRENVPYEDFVEGVKTNLIKNRVIAQAVSQDVTIDDKMLKDYYDAHWDEFADEEYSLQHIFVKAESGCASEGQESLGRSRKRGVFRRCGKGVFRRAFEGRCQRDEEGRPHSRIERGPAPPHTGDLLCGDSDLLRRSHPQARRCQEGPEAAPRGDQG